MNSKNSNSRSKKGELTAFSCKLCSKNVSDYDHAILCEVCQTWVHMKCNHLNCIDDKYLQGCDEPWYCLPCTNTLFPFSNLNNQSFLTFNGDNNTVSNETKYLNSSLLLKPPPNLALLFNQFNNAFLKIAVIQKM